MKNNRFNFFSIVVLTASFLISQAAAAPNLQKDTIINGSTLKFEPVQTHTNAPGALYIQVYPSDCIIFLNEKNLGMGNKMIDSLPCGYYHLFLKYGEKSKSEDVFIQGGRVNTFSYSLEKQYKIIMEPSYSFALIHNAVAYGPMIGLGIKKNDNYYGICLNYDIETNVNSKKEAKLGGLALFQWSHYFAINKAFAVAPGFCAGFWASESTVYMNYTTDEYDYNEDIYFGGPTVKLLFSKKSLGLKIDYSMLIGTYVAHVFGIGGSISF